jgi:hypothetical protein
MQISKHFKNALKIHETPVCKLAWEIGVTPNILYHLLNAHQLLLFEDERLLKLADKIDYPRSEVFKKNTDGGKNL